MKHSEDNDPAWDLLKHAKKTEPAGNFTQNVLREVGQLESGQEQSGGGWFAARWVGSLAAVAALVIGAFVIFNPATGTNEVASVADDVAVAAVDYDDEITIEEFAAELEELAYLGDLMAVPDTSLLADEELAVLLF